MNVAAGYEATVDILEKKQQQKKQHAIGDMLCFSSVVSLYWSLWPL